MEMAAQFLINWEDFSKPKTLYSEIVQAPQFYLDREGSFLPEATCFLLVGNNLDYLYRILHSNIVTFFFKKYYAGGGLGDHGYRYKKAFFEKLPIPLWTGSDVQKFIAESSPIIDIEHKIANIYTLTSQETDYIMSVTQYQ